MDLKRRAASEFLGSALLLAAVVGSGIMAERLSKGDAAMTLLANTLATGAALVVLILVFGPVSGAHFNPIVTLAIAGRQQRPWKEVPVYITMQVAGAFLGVMAANLMFDLPALGASFRVRTGGAQWLGEGVATFGLLITVLGCEKHRPPLAPVAIAGYITAAYWFTSSTSFANPAVTLARSMSDTFAGIRPADVPGFIVAQVAGGAVALLIGDWLFHRET